jgi:hypothetical protein
MCYNGEFISVEVWISDSTYHFYVLREMGILTVPLLYLTY